MAFYFYDDDNDATQNADLFCSAAADDTLYLPCLAYRYLLASLLLCHSFSADIYFIGSPFVFPSTASEWLSRLLPSLRAMIRWSSRQQPELESESETELFPSEDMFHNRLDIKFSKNVLLNKIDY